MSKCQYDNLKCLFSSNINNFIEKAKKIHGEKYNYQKVDYKNSQEKVIIICKIHGEFKQTPNSHLQGSGCLKCQLCPKCLLWQTHGKPCQYCKPITKNKLFYKTKEMDVVKYLKEKLPNDEFIHNKSVGIECTGGHFYPDIRFDCLWFQLIVEVDEYKHRGADYKCDEKRMYDITANLGQPCIFIRYNPDSKESNKETLLEKIQYYLNLKDKYSNTDKELDNVYYKELEIDDLLGFKTEYLFYE